MSGELTVSRPDVVIDHAVTGDLTLAGENVTIRHSVLRDVVVGASGSGFVIEDSQVHAFNIDGADNWIIRRDIVDFKGISYNGYNGGSIMYNAKNWKILDSTFRGAYVIANPSQHSEAWFIGAGNDGGLIQGNTFDDNGTTGHLFFTWWGSEPGVNDPKNICVTGNTFTRSHNRILSSICAQNSIGDGQHRHRPAIPTRTTGQIRTRGSWPSSNTCDLADDAPRKRRCGLSRNGYPMINARHAPRGGVAATSRRTAVSERIASRSDPCSAGRGTVLRLCNPPRDPRRTDPASTRTAFEGAGS